jgi:ABC-type antimicrobial peptide transport system permease subunit
MATVRLWLRADTRQRWRALLGLALLLGLAGGVVLTAAAGAHRTDTAYPRLLSWANATQFDITPQGTGLTGYYTALARLPRIAAFTAESLYQTSLPSDLRTIVESESSPDGALGITVDKVKVLSGALYDPARRGEAMIDPQLASLEHLRPGGTLRLAGIPNGPDGSPDYGKAVPLAFTVTAIVVFDNQVVRTGTNAAEPTALLSSPFAATAAARSITFGDEAAVRLAPGASQAAFVAAAAQLAKRYTGTAQRPGTAGSVLDFSLADQVAATERAIRPEAVALATFAVLAGLIGLAVLGQLLSRQLTLDAAEFPVLRALGAPRAALVALSLARLAVVTVTGGVLAVAVAVAASPLMPIGPARLAEPAPGVEVNLAILGAGLAAIALLPLAVLLPVALRAATAASGALGGVAGGGRRSRPSRLAAALTRSGSVTGGIGARMAFEPGRGRTAVPVRSALAGSVIAIAALMAAAVFGASLVHLVGTPSAYGQNWDQEVDLGFGGVPLTLGAKLIGTETANVTGYAAGNYGMMSIGGLSVPAVGIDQSRGTGYATLLAGRAPAAADEIALGAQTLRAIGGHVGQVVTVTVDDTATAGPSVPHVMRIVGVAILPAFSRGGFSPTGLGTGALVTASVLFRQSTSLVSTVCKGSSTCYNFFLLRYKPGTSLATASARLVSTLAALGCPLGSCIVTPDQRPGDIKDYASVRDTPLVLAAALIALGVGILAHVLLTGVRRRRRDLAVLKVLGLTRLQVLRVVGWEATAFAAVALLAGLPVGVFAGRQAWALFTSAAGVAPSPDVPVTLILLAVPVTLLAANLIAAWPGWTAARVRPAVALRAE